MNCSSHRFLLSLAFFVHSCYRRRLRRSAPRCASSAPDRPVRSAYYGLGLTLGNADVRLDELVAAYAAFARGGVWREPACILPAATSVIVK